jgi:AcrR family transcriptional regulator
MAIYWETKVDRTRQGGTHLALFLKFHCGQSRKTACWGRFPNPTECPIRGRLQRNNSKERQSCHMTGLSLFSCYAILSLLGGCKVPKDTFFNLPELKRKAIFNAAVREFAVSLFSEASINRIIKMAQIPRGSFYQYFDGKEDLFTYVIAKIFAEITEIMKSQRRNGQDVDALSLFMEKVYATAELNKEKPEYVQITLLQSRDKTYFVRQFFEMSDDQRRNAIQLFEFDKQRGIVREDIDSSLVIDMVYILSKEIFFDVGMDSEAYIEKMEAVIKIIREGIRRKSI